MTLDIVLRTKTLVRLYNLVYESNPELVTLYHGDIKRLGDTVEMQLGWCTYQLTINNGLTYFHHDEFRLDDYASVEKAAKEAAEWFYRQITIGREGLFAAQMLSKNELVWGTL